MEYSINQLAELTGLTTRTLRYYDQIGLLKPLRTGGNGYRYYGELQLDRLQQILFYKQRGFELKQIGKILSNPDYDAESALLEHLRSLEKEKDNLEMLIQNVKNTISSLRGEYEMSDNERFEAFKKAQIEENEAKYGSEIREKYGEEEVDESYKKMFNMSEEQWERFKTLETEILEKLQQAVKAGVSPEEEIGKEITKLHKEWILMTWEKYTSEAHKGLALMYICDERFKAYYDSEVEGCAEFLQKAIEHWA